MHTSVARRFALVTVLASACVKQLPPAATPEAVAPRVDTSAPIATGQGRLVIDVVDGPTPVERVRMASEAVGDGYQLHEEPEPLCAASPCVTDVPTGNLLLGFPVIGNGDLEVELVHVDAGTSVYRRSLSMYQDHSGALKVWGIVGASVGSAAAITGIVLLPIGLSKDNHGLTEAGGITLGVGAAVLAFGIWAIRHDAATYRPGAANHFSL